MDKKLVLIIVLCTTLIVLHSTTGSIHHPALMLDNLRRDHNVSLLCTVFWCHAPDLQYYISFRQSGQPIAFFEVQQQNASGKIHHNAYFEASTNLTDLEIIKGNSTRPNSLSPSFEITLIPLNLTTQLLLLNETYWCEYSDSNFSRPIRSNIVQLNGFGGGDHRSGWILALLPVVLLLVWDQSLT